MPKVSVGCAATPEGNVKLAFLYKGQPQAGVEMPATSVGGVIASLVSAAAKAAELSGQACFKGIGASLSGGPVILPTAIGLSEGEPHEEMALVVQAGMARFAIALTNPRELAEAILAATQNQTH